MVFDDSSSDEEEEDDDDFEMSIAVIVNEHQSIVLLLSCSLLHLDPFVCLNLNCKNFKFIVFNELCEL